MNDSSNTSSAASPTAPVIHGAADDSTAVGHPPTAKRRWLGSSIAVLLLALLVGAAWYLVQNKKTPAAAGAGMGAGALRALTVTVGQAMVKRETLPVTLTAMGTVVPTSTVSLTSQVSGVLKAVFFTEGQMVKKGQKLALIDPAPFAQALLQAQGQMARDQAQLDAARVTLKRYQALWQQDSIARQDLDTQAALVKQLEGTVLADQAQVQAAQLNLGYTRITSPIDGRIGLRAIDPGNHVTAGGSAGIAVITEIAPIDVVFTVAQDQIPAVLQAQKNHPQLAVDALDRAGSKILAQGVFTTLDNQVDTTTGTAKAKARFANADHALFPNQFVNIALTLTDLTALVVPVTAIRTGGNGDFVYVINSDRTVTQRPVIRGRATVDWITISSGLQEGEQVVTEGADRLKDGATVALPGDVSVGTFGTSGTAASRGAGEGQRRSGDSQAGGDAGTAAPSPASDSSAAAATAAGPAKAQ